MASRRWSRFADTLRTQLWPLPTLGIVVAVALAVGLARLDEAVDDDLPIELASILFGGGPNAAREVLGAIAGSLITVTSLTFSLTVVTLQLASSQFSPRLLRTFTADRFVQVTLALFVTTFVYALTLLRTVRTSTEGGDFVPRIGITVGYLLTLASVLGLVAFLAHLVRQIRVETMLRNVHQEAQQTIERMLPEVEDAQQLTSLPTPPPFSVWVTSRSSGFLTAIDEEGLLAAAVDADACVVLDRPAGSSLVEGTPVARAWPSSGEWSDESREQLVRCVRAALTTGYERTASQDLGFGLRQLADVAARALSPGVNDPTTAVHTLGHSSALLCELVRRDVQSARLTDERGTTRIVLMREDFSDLLELAVAQPRRYGAQDPGVLARIYWLLREVGWIVTREEQRDAVAAQLDRLDRTATQQEFDQVEQATLQGLSEAVRAALRGEWSPST